MSSTDDSKQEPCCERLLAASMRDAVAVAIRSSDRLDWRSWSSRNIINWSDFVPKEDQAEAPVERSNQTSHVQQPIGDEQFM